MAQITAFVQNPGEVEITLTATFSLNSWKGLAHGSNWHPFIERVREVVADVERKNLLVQGSDDVLKPAPKALDVDDILDLLQCPACGQGGYSAAYIHALRKGTPFEIVRCRFCGYMCAAGSHHFDGAFKPPPDQKPLASHPGTGPSSAP